VLDIYASHYVVEANSLCEIQAPTTNVVFTLENSRFVSATDFFNVKAWWSLWVEQSIGSENKVGNFFFLQALFCIFVVQIFCKTERVL
jgi:hypothetical protein